MSNMTKLKIGVLVMLAGLVASACGREERASKELPPEAVSGNGATPYPGAVDERLSQDGRNALRERGNLQR